MAKLLSSGYFWWIVGIAAGQIWYLIGAPFYGAKRWQAFCYGLIALLVMGAGAKIMYLIENFSFVLENGVGFQGFSLFGAVFILPVACLFIARVFQKDVRAVQSSVIASSLLMLGFYRFDCLVSGCCGGISVGGRTVPTQIIEAVFCFALAAAFIALDLSHKTRAGQTYALFFLLYGAMRFVLEFFRVRTELFGAFSLSHLWALVSAAVGCFYLIYRRRERRAAKNA